MFPSIIPSPLFSPIHLEYLFTLQTGFKFEFRIFDLTLLVVLSLSQNLEVCYDVICFIIVYMVNVFVVFQNTALAFLHHETCEIHALHMMTFPHNLDVIPALFFVEVRAEYMTSRI